MCRHAAAKLSAPSRRPARRLPSFTSRQRPREGCPNTRRGIPSRNYLFRSGAEADCPGRAYGVRLRTFSSADDLPKPLKRVFAILGAFQLLASLPAEGECPVEVKLLLPVSTTHNVIASLGFGKETRTRVYLFDTQALDLLRQGVIIRVREGGKNDLTVKVRVPQGKNKPDDSLSGEQFACEIDQTRSGASTSYAVTQKYEVMKVPENGTDMYKLLDAAQIRLLQKAQVSIDWTRVVRIASIDSTSWQTTSQSPSGSLALELWEWSEGKVLELSAKVAPEAASSKLADLESLLKTNNLPLSASQDTKTSTVLETLTDHTSRPR